MTGVKITRQRRETRRYERQVLVTLDMAKGQTRAEALTVTVQQVLGDLEHYESEKPRVTLNVKRTRRDGKASYNGKRKYDLAIVDSDPETRAPWHDANDFTPETVERLRALRDDVLREFAGIAWDQV
jgi:hypothetical protein